MLDPAVAAPLRGTRVHDFHPPSTPSYPVGHPDRIGVGGLAERARPSIRIKNDARTLAPRVQNLGDLADLGDLDRFVPRRDSSADHRPSSCSSASRRSPASRRIPSTMWSPRASVASASRIWEM